MIQEKYTTSLNGLLTGLATGQLKLLFAPNSQSQLISAVPEPASWAMMLSGFALVGGIVRRRTPRNTVTA